MAEAIHSNLMNRAWQSDPPVTVSTAAHRSADSAAELARDGFRGAARVPGWLTRTDTTAGAPSASDLFVLGPHLSKVVCQPRHSAGRVVSAAPLSGGARAGGGGELFSVADTLDQPTTRGRGAAAGVHAHTAAEPAREPRGEQRAPAAGRPPAGAGELECSVGLVVPRRVKNCWLSPSSRLPEGTFAGL